MSKRIRTNPVGTVYPFIEAAPGTLAVVRYPSGDPDDFVALAHAWLIDRRADGYEDGPPVAVLPPEPRLYRKNVTRDEEFSWYLGTPSRPGQGTWIGSLLKVVQIGCTECHGVHGRHAGGCINAGVTSLVTLQFGGAQRVGDRHPHSPLVIHAVRTRRDVAGGVGPTLCDINRFSPDTPGWSIGGGHDGPTMKFRACYRCAGVARRDFPGLTIYGMRSHVEAFAAESGNPLPPKVVAARTADVAVAVVLRVAERTNA